MNTKRCSQNVTLEHFRKINRTTFILVLFFSFYTRTYSEIVFANKDQQWDYIGIENTANYTSLLFDITILNDDAGCFDAHTYDIGNASIFIEGEFGRHKIYKSIFEGNYEPWIQATGSVNWNYYEEDNEGIIAHAKFIFARIPLGINNIRFHFYGGWADESAESDKYECPKFDIFNVPVPNNDNYIRQTGLTENQLINIWEKENNISDIEGIYSFVKTSDPKWWGPIRHRIAIKKEGTSYLIIYLNGSNNKIWHEGELKGDCNKTATTGLYKVNSWRLENKILSGSDFYIRYSQQYISLYDSLSGVETYFIKLYPETEMEKHSHRSISINTKSL